VLINLSRMIDPKPKTSQEVKMVQDCIFCLQEAALQFLSKKPVYPTDPKDCFVNPPCGCPNPGKEIQCEDCPHLEACFSSCKKGSGESRVGR
jgi:hypothetical protein